MNPKQKKLLQSVADRTSHPEHLATLECSQGEERFLADAFFPRNPTVTTAKTVSVTKKIPGNRELAMLACDCIAGEPRPISQGQITDIFEPATLVDAVNLTACDEIWDDLAIGEERGSNRTWADRYRAAINIANLEALERIERRREWYAAESLVKGEYLLEGPLYGKKLVNFQREDCLTMNWEQGADWDLSGKNLTVNRLRLLLVYVAEQLRLYGCGARLSHVICGSLIHQKLATMRDWEKFCVCPGDPTYIPSNSRFQQLLPTTGAIGLGDYLSMGVQFWCYDEWFDQCRSATSTAEECDMPTPYLPPNGMIFVASDANGGLMGTTKYAAIRNDHAVGQGPRGAGDVDLLIHSYTDQASGCSHTKLWSKPLVIPQNVNGSAYVEICPMPEDAEEAMLRVAQSRKAQRERGEDQRNEAEQALVKQQMDDYRAKVDAETDAKLAEKDAELEKVKQEAAGNKDADAAAKKAKADAKKAADAAAAKDKEIADLKKKLDAANKQEPRT